MQGSADVPPSSPDMTSYGDSCHGYLYLLPSSKSSYSWQCIQRLSSWKSWLAQAIHVEAAHPDTKNDEKSAGNDTAAEKENSKEAFAKAREDSEKVKEDASFLNL